MSHPKSRGLRERLSIDPDVPQPIRPPRRGEAPSTYSNHEDSGVDEQEIGPVNQSMSATASENLGEEEPGQMSSHAATRSDASGRMVDIRASRGQTGVDWVTALDDPAIDPDGNRYRSFYISDEVFARFRSAVYWTSRRPDADDVPDSMSAGIEEYMAAVAVDLEGRFNDASPFPPTPEQIKSHRRRQKKK